MKKALLYLIRLATIVMVLAGIVLSLPPITSLYFILFEGAQPGDRIFPDAFVLPLHLSLAFLAVVAGLFWGAYAADRFAVSRLRALA